MTTRKSFPVYLSWAGPIEMLSIEEKAQLLGEINKIQENINKDGKD